MPPVGLKASPLGQGIWSASWAVPVGQVAPVKEALYEVCAAVGVSQCSAPVAAPVEGPVSVSVPGPGTWTLVVWLVDAAGNGTRAQSAMVNATEAAATEGTGGPTANGSTPSGATNGGPNSTMGDTSPSGAVIRKPAIHVHAAVRHGRLNVVVGGPNGEVVRIGYSARLQGHRVCAASHTAKLRHRRARTVFVVRRCARGTRIYVTVRVGGHVMARARLVLAHHWQHRDAR
jgi:hypothetical protein